MRSAQKTAVHCTSVSLNDVVLQVLDDTRGSQSLLCTGALRLFHYLPSGEQRSVEVEESRTASADKYKHWWLASHLLKAGPWYSAWLGKSLSQPMLTEGCSTKCTSLAEPSSTVSWSNPVHCLWRIITFRQREKVIRMDIQVKHGYQKWWKLMRSPCPSLTPSQYRIVPSLTPEQCCLT